MTKFLTPAFKTAIALRSYEQLASPTGSYYLVGAYSNTGTTIPDAENSVDNVMYDFDRNMIFGKKLTSSDVIMMIRDIPWVNGSTYDMYDDATVDLNTKDFYVVADDAANSKSIFKCLFNGRVHSGNTYVVTPVSDKPTITRVSPDDEYYRTADGYVWKFICNITEEDVLSFGTTGFVPVRNNSEVTLNAVNGSIDQILIEDTGGKYLSFAQGNIKTAEYTGDPKKVSLQSNVQQVMYTFSVTGATSGLMIGDSVTVTVTVTGVSGTITFDGTLYDVNSSTIKVVTSTNTPLLQSDIDAATTKTITQSSTSQTVTIVTVDKDVIVSLSGKTGFYTGSALYIRSGTGAGQLRTITAYDITTDSERVATIDRAFDVVPDSTSQFEIAPAVIISGDGTGAEAICHVNSVTTGIKMVEIINRGSGYTFADVSVVGTSGMIDPLTSSIISPTPAILRAIIPPKGGHGYNAYTELYAHTICISKKFIRDEVPYTNEYNKVGLLSTPSFANTSANTVVFDGRSIANTTIIYGTTFSIGETITQEDNNFTGIIHEISGSDVYLTGTKGSLNTVGVITGQSSGTIATVNSVTSSNRILNSGTILYVEDLASPINRSSIQTETIKLVVEY